MSTSLYFEPICNKGISLSDNLKYILRKKYGSSVDAILDDHDINYLEGIRDACNNEKEASEVQKLIDAIEKYNSIKVWEE